MCFPMDILEPLVFTWLIKLKLKIQFLSHTSHIVRAQKPHVAVATILDMQT